MPHSSRAARVGGTFPTPPQPSTPAILLVDDNPDVLNALAATLRWAGYAVIACEGPTAALETAELTHFDLLVTDFEMPHVNGFELACLLSLKRSVPTLLISGIESSHLPVGPITIRGWGLLPKPIDAGRLIGSIEFHLSAGRKPVSPVPTTQLSRALSGALVA